MSRCTFDVQVGDDGSEPAHTKARSGPMDFWHLPGCWGLSISRLKVGRFLAAMKGGGKDV